MRVFFLIDDDQLKDKTPQECFVLGFELAQIHTMAETVTDHDVDKTVHADNIDRIEAALRKRGRTFEWMWPSDDISESWVYLKILRV